MIKMQEALDLIYKYSPTWQVIVNEDRLETGKGRLTELLGDPSSFESLDQVYPLDIAMYALRLDLVHSYVTQENKKKFIDEAREVRDFRTFMSGIVGFGNEIKKKAGKWWYLLLLSVEMHDLLGARDKKELIRFLRHSGLFKIYNLSMLNWPGAHADSDLMRIYHTRRNKKTRLYRFKALHKLWPVDMALYAMRIEAMLQDKDISDLLQRIKKMPAINRYPLAIVELGEEWIKYGR